MHIEVLKNKNKKYYWRIVSGNNRVLAHSEEYSKRGSAVKTAEMVAEQANLSVYIDGKLTVEALKFIPYNFYDEGSS